MNNPATSWAEVTIDCLDPEHMARFWSELLGVGVADPPLPGWARTAPTVPGGPVLNFQPVHRPKEGKTRVHLDLWTDDMAETVRWIADHGGSFTGEIHEYPEGTVAVMADPEGTEFCIVGPAGSRYPL